MLLNQQIDRQNVFFTGADLEIFDRGGPIDYSMGIYHNYGHTKIVAN